MLVKSSRLAELLPPDAFNIVDLRPTRVRGPQKGSDLLKITPTIIKIPREVFKEFGERFYVSVVVRGNNIWLVRTEGGRLVTVMSANAYRIYRCPSDSNVLKDGVYTPIKGEIIAGLPGIRIPGAVAAGAREVSEMAIPRQRTSSGNH
jgi:hypothetical protein